MNLFRSIFGCILVAIFLVGCGSDKPTSTPNPRTITVTIRNLDAVNAVHIYIGEGEPSEENLVLPKESIISMVFALQIGYIVTVYVAQNKPGSLPFFSLNVRVTQTSWDSREAELHWTGGEIVPVGW